jgi:hypothetical protein
MKTPRAGGSPGLGFHGVKHGRGAALRIVGGAAQQGEQLAPGADRRRRRGAGSRVARSTPTASSKPSSADTRTRSPSRKRLSGPPPSASGETWIAAGTLPLAPLIRPSVTSATRWPRSCSTPSGGVSLCSSGMPLARGPWKRTTTTTSRSSSPALNAFSTSLLVGEDARRRFDRPARRVDRAGLERRAAEVALDQPHAAVGQERGRLTGPQHGVVAAFGHLAPDQLLALQLRMRGPGGEVVGAGGQDVGVEQPFLSSSRRRRPCRRHSGSRSRRPSRWDRPAPAAARRR